MAKEEQEPRDPLPPEDDLLPDYEQAEQKLTGEEEEAPGEAQKPVYYRKHQPYYSKRSTPHYEGTYGSRPYGGAGYDGGPGYYGGPGGYGAPAGYGGGYYRDPYYGQHQEEDENSTLGSLDPARVLRVCLKKLPVVLNIILLSAVAAWAYYQALPETYSATCLVEMSVRGRRIMPTAGAVFEDSGFGMQTEDLFNTRLTKLKSKEVQAQAVARFRRDFPKIPISDEELVSAVQGISLSMRRRTHLVEITTMSVRPELAAALVNVYADTAVQHAVDENKTLSDSAVFWLKAQAETQKKMLEKADQAIVDYMAQNQLDTLANQKSAVEASLTSYNSELVDVENASARAVDLIKVLESLQANPASIGSMPESVPRASEIAQVLSRLQAAQAERDALLVRYTAKHPEVLEKEKQVAVIQQQLVEAAKRANETAVANLDLLRKQLDTLRWKKEEQLKLGADLDLKIKAISMKVEQLEREKSANTMSYRGILNRMEEARLAQDDNTATITIVEKADVPRQPMSRGLVQIMFIGVLLGVAIGVSVALMLDKLEDKIASPADIEKRLRLKILAVLPHVTKTTREQLALTVSTKKFSQMTEAFAGLRALLESPRYEEVNRCILVISTQPEEGKTISVCNLALSYAQSGLRTLLVDFDMRRPRIARIFDLGDKTKASLLHVLEKDDPSLFPELPVETEHDRLHVVISKAAEELSPADIMGRKSVKAFIQWAKAHYDRVIIDSPPFGLVSDSVVLGQQAGAVVLVCRVGRSRYNPMLYALREFRHADCKVIGAIVNDVRYRGSAASYDYRRY